MDINTILAAVIEFISIAGIIMFLLTFAVNIVVEVIKGMFPKLPTAFLTVGVSIGITLLAMAVAVSILEITITWYYAVGAVVLGIFVAYAAMYGFDKYKELYDRLKALSGK